MYVCTKYEPSKHSNPTRHFETDPGTDISLFSKLNWFHAPLNPMFNVLLTRASLCCVYECTYYYARAPRTIFDSWISKGCISVTYFIHEIINDSSARTRPRPRKMWSDWIDCLPFTEIHAWKYEAWHCQRTMYMIIRLCGCTLVQWISTFEYISLSRAKNSKLMLEFNLRKKKFRRKNKSEYPTKKSWHGICGVCFLGEGGGLHSCFSHFIRCDDGTHYTFIACFPSWMCRCHARFFVPGIQGMRTTLCPWRCFCVHRVASLSCFNSKDDVSTSIKSNTLILTLRQGHNGHLVLNHEPGQKQKEKKNAREANVYTVLF